MKKMKNEYVEILRALGCIMVVFVHSANIYSYVGNLPGAELSSVFAAPFKILSACGVPIFFMISGYLSTGMENKGSYAENMKRKCKTLVRPLVIWICFYAIFEMLGHFIAPALFDDLVELSIGSLVIKLVGIPFVKSPIYGPLWFIRELFVLFLLYPITLFVVEHLSGRILVPLLFLAAVVTCLYSNGYYLGRSLPFFAFGIVGGEKMFGGGAQQNVKHLIVYLTTVVTGLSYVYDMCDMSPGMHSIFEVVLILSFFPVVFCAGKRITERKGKLFGLLMTVGRFSFMIYVLHGKPLTILQNVLIRIIPQDNFVLVAEYMLLPILVIGGIVVFSMFFSKSMPKLYAFVTGGR